MKRFRSALVFATSGLIGIALAGQAAKLKTTTFDDGTGSIGLPGGWNIEGAYRGQVAARGGGGEVVVLGMPWAILKPGTSLDSLGGAQTTPRARSGDLVGALREVLAKNGGQRLLSVRSRPASPAVSGANAAFFLYEFQSQGTTYTSTGYFTALDPGPSSPSWSLYCSVLVAPKAKFVKSLPTMRAIWKSWRSNGHNPARGSQSEMFDKVLQGRRDSYEEIQREFRKLL